MAYDRDNVFAKILRGDLPSECVYQDDATFVFMDIMPRADGHLLVIPKSPARNLLDASAAQLADCIAVTQKMAQAVMTAFAADGATIQQFNETAGGQEVFHLHFHVLPRHAGVPLRPPGTMEDREIIAGNAEKIRAVLAEMAG